MAATYSPIATYTVSGSAVASYTFSSIPSTYTDLVLRISARTSVTGQTFDNIEIQFNNDSATNYSYIRLRGSGSAASSSIGSNTSAINAFAASNSADSTANTFSNWELYIPSQLS